MSVYYGVVKGRVVMLPENAQLEEGLTVEVRLPRRPRSKLAPSEAAFKRKLLENGLLSEIKTSPPARSTEERALLQGKGKPLSQLIIEERR